MGVTFRNRDLRRVLSDPLEMESLLAELFSKEETTFFIEQPTNENLLIVYTRRGSVVIYTNCNEPYVALDASRTPTWENKRVNLRIEGETTPFYANVVIRKRDARAIAKEFCASGTLSSTVYWLKEGTEPR